MKKMRIDSMKRLNHQGEGPFLSYVPYEENISPEKVTREIGDSICALANTSGGTVLLGVDGAGKASGVKDAKKLLPQIIDLIPAYINPLPDFSAGIEKYGNRYIIKFTVMPSPGEPLPHQSGSGQILVRIGRKNLPVLAEYYHAFSRARSEILFERTFPQGATWDDLDPELLNRFCKILKDPRSPRELLTSVYHIAEYDGDRIRPTLAALLLFGKEVGKWHPRPGVELIHVEGSHDKKSRQWKERRLRLDLPLMVLPGIVFTHLGGEYLEKEYRYDLFFKERVRFPEDAWKEALINALVHRDYSIKGAGIEVWLWDDRMEIKSPGLPPGPVTIDEMSRDGIHLSSNPLIARVFTDIGLMSEFGRGISHMNSEMENQKLHPPEISREGFFLKVILKLDPIYDKETQKWLRRFNRYPLGPDHVRILAFAHAHADTFSTMDYRRENKVDRDTAYREVQDMVKMGIIQKIPGSRTRYKIKK
ncbi:MAG: putative DNA binding domain-containing protein [Candidatus Eremiobacteraeota bacterium]|nr:putative DNA binding domain-containing protein [Candidatus Eremiobacteraeota bacterium]